MGIGCGGLALEAGLADLAGLGVHYGHGVTGVVHERLLAGLVFLAKDGIQGALPGVVEFAVPAVLVAVGMDGLVLQPKKLEGDALPAEFGVNGLPLREGTRAEGWRRGDRIQQRLQGTLGEFVGQGPSDPCRLSPSPDAANRGPGHVHTLGHLTV